MTSAAMRVPFNELAPGIQAIRGDLDAAIGRVLADHGAPKTPDLGGKAGTKEVGAAVAAALG